MSRSANALIVSADAATTTLISEAATRLGLTTVHAAKGAEALQRLEELVPAVVVLDLGLTDAPTLPLPRHPTDRIPTPVIGIAPVGNVRVAVEAMRNGASNVLDRLATGYEVEQAIKAVLTHGSENSYEAIFGPSPTMQALEPVVTRAGEALTPVLIRGEDGVGKEVIARVIHELSDKSARPFLKLALRAMPAERVPSELNEILAAGPDGTLFLDEVGEASAATQARLLRLLARRGQTLRVIAATSADLNRLVAAGVFRRDLYQRLALVTVDVPPLRERREDIAALTHRFLDQFAREFQCPRPHGSKSMAELFEHYEWPGNVRELASIVKRWVVLGDERNVRAEIEARQAAVRRRRPAPTSAGLGLREIGRRAAREAEHAALQEALLRARGNRAAAARELKVSYRTILQKMTESGFLAPRSNELVG